MRDSRAVLIVIMNLTGTEITFDPVRNHHQDVDIRQTQKYFTFCNILRRVDAVALVGIPLDVPPWVLVVSIVRQPLQEGLEVPLQINSARLAFQKHPMRKWRRQQVRRVVPFFTFFCMALILLTRPRTFFKGSINGRFFEIASNRSVAAGTNPRQAKNDRKTPLRNLHTVPEFSYWSEDWVLGAFHLATHCVNVRLLSVTRHFV